MQGIRNWPSFEGCRTVAQKWRCLSELLHSASFVLTSHDEEPIYCMASLCIGSVREAT